MDIQGAVEIAAPAVQVLTLGDRADFRSGTFTGDGTSLSAPMVAGVAAQLLAMDPDLTAAQVKDYIIRGSRQPRLNPTAGQMDPSLAVRVTGFADQPYQLDAYGALTLLSQEHPEAPLCGVTADLAFTPDGSTLEGIQLRRLPDAPDAEHLALDTASVPYASGLSLAQGGRVLALFTADDQHAHRTVFLDQRGQQAGVPLEDVERHFLERDTADYSWTTTQAGWYPVITLRRGDSAHTVLHLDPVAAVEPDTADVYDARVVVSPSGDYAAVYVAANLSQDCGFHWTWAVARVSDGAITRLREDTYVCGSLAGVYTYGGMAWTPDSRRLTLPLQFFEDEGCGVFVYQTVVTTWEVGGTPQSLAPIADLYLAGPSYTADGALLSTYEWNARLHNCARRPPRRTSRTT